MGISIDRHAPHNPVPIFSVGCPIPTHGNKPRSAYYAKSSADIFSGLSYSHAWKQIGFNINNKTSTANKTKFPPQEKSRHFNTTNSHS
ncbi:TPA: hypothetical protein ACX3FQ_003921, partial [Vibrio parahaemolyticus]